MRFPRTVATVALLVGVITGGTVLSQPIAGAAAAVGGVFITNDAAHPVPVREQGNGIPSTAFSSDVQVRSGVVNPLGLPMRVHGPDAGGTRYAISSIALSNQQSYPIEIQVATQYSPAGGTDCANSRFETAILVPAMDTLQLTFPQPYVVDAVSDADPARPVCLALNLATSADAEVDALVVGFTFR
jgi:hypothetical protein